MNPPRLVSLLRVGMPQKMSDIIDWPTLRLESPELPVPQIPQLNERTADLVFSVNLKDTGKPAQIFLLFEHKSYRDTDLARQLADYQFRLYLQDDFESLIIPIVVLQNVEGGSVRVEFLDLFSNLPDEHRRILASHSVNFQALVISVDEIDRLGLARQTDIDAAMRTMSNVRDAEPTLLQEVVDRMKYVPPEEQVKDFNLMFDYISEYNEGITLDSVQVETPEEQQMINSTAEALRQEGREEVATNLLQEGMDPEKVVKLTQLSPDRVQSLQRESNQDSGR